MYIAYVLHVAGNKFTILRDMVFYDNQATILICSLLALS